MKKLMLAVLLAPAVALASGYDVPNVNPRDLSMAGSAVAAQVDAVAAFQNPAALSRVQGVDVNVALSGLFLGTEWNGPSSGPLAGQSESTKFSPVPPVSIFAAYGWELAGRPFGVGVGFNVPGGGNVFWEDDWEGRGRIITVDRKIYAGYLTAGYELIPNLRLGGGLVYYYGTEYLKQGIQPFPEGYGELSTRGGALSFDLSAEYTLPTIPLTIGADYKYQGKMNLEGDGKFVVPGGTLPGSPTPNVDQGVEHELTYPSVLNVGLAYRLNDPWLVTFGFTWIDYSVYTADVFEGDRGARIEVPRNYGDSYVFRVGAEYALRENLRLRAGLLRDISGIDRDYASPTLPDSNVWAGSLGASWGFRQNLAVNAALFYANFDELKATGPEAFPGSYETNVWIVSAGVTWRADLDGGGR
ncbi:MAG TPA: outer membrane protein transport protein [Anaeromyxobacter sp.]|nr:outer membrane protein transport protein [Anaeromyxobacter sp.]